MFRKLMGVCMMLLACLLGLVSLLGVIGLFVSDRTDGRFSAALIFLVIALMVVPVLWLGIKLMRAKTPPTGRPTPLPVLAHDLESTAVPAAGPDRDGPPPMKAPFSPVVAFPSRKPPEPYDPVYDEVSQRLIDDLLALNRDDVPFRIVDGRDEGVDLIAEWRIVDAEFYALFAAAGVRRVFRIFMKLDPRKRTVRAKDQEYGVRWNKGVPAILEADYFQGQTFSVRWHGEIALRKDTKLPGFVVNYTFSTPEIKGPIKAVVKAAGWRYKGVAFAKL